MSINLFSVIMAVISSSIMMLIIFLFRKKIGFIDSFGVPTLVIMLVFCFLRMALPVEILKFQYNISDKYILTKLLDPLLHENYDISTKILLVIWIVGFLVLMIQFVVSHNLSLKKIRCLDNTADEKIFDKLVEIDTQNKLTIIRSNKISVPMLAGIKNPVILLPQIEYSDTELDSIIKHEYMHYKNKDNIIKFVVHIFWRIFWWNPFSYLFLINLSKTLELRCDKKVTSEMSYNNKIDYLQSMLEIIKKRSQFNKKDNFRIVRSCYIQEKNKFDLSQRIKYVLAENISIKLQNIIKYLVVILMLIIFFMSYFFIIQPSYTPQKNNCEDKTKTYNINNSNCNIIEKDNKYYVILNDGTSYEIEDEKSVKQMLDSGIRIIKEE